MSQSGNTNSLDADLVEVLAD